MRFIIMVKSDESSEAGVPPTPALIAEMNEFNEKATKAGIMLSGEGLHASSKGVQISLTAGKFTVKDGPFAEAKELIGGFWILQTKSLEECIEWVKRAPFDGGAEIEIRQVFEDEDFGEEFTPELREQEARIRAQAEQNAR